MKYGNTGLLTAAGTEFKTRPLVLSFGGGYNFNPYLGIETEYSLAGKLTRTTYGAVNSTETLKSSALQVTAVGAAPFFNEQFSVIGKLGLARTRIEYSYSSAGVTAASSGSRTNLVYGFGGRYTLNKQWGVRVMYMDYGKTQVGTAGSVGMEVISVSGLYSF